MGCPHALIDPATHPIPSDILGATVQEMWEEGQGWRWDIFSPYLHQNTLKLIQAHKVKENSEVQWEIYCIGMTLLRVFSLSNPQLRLLGKTQMNSKKKFGS